MSRYIDADKLKENMMQIANNSSMKKYIIDTYIDTAQQAELKPIVYGEWIKTEGEFDYNYTCSNCNHTWSEDFDVNVECFKFCPMCGCEMRKESEEEE